MSNNENEVEESTQPYSTVVQSDDLSQGSSRTFNTIDQGHVVAKKVDDSKVDGMNGDANRIQENGKIGKYDEIKGGNIKVNDKVAANADGEEKKENDKGLMAEDVKRRRYIEALSDLDDMIDRQYQMSRLAAKFYYTRHFWLMFLPSIILTMLSGIFAFMIKSELPLSGQTKSWIAFYVGCASFVSVFLQNLSNELDYDHCSKSQHTLATSIKRIIDKVHTCQSDYDNFSTDKLDNLRNEYYTVLDQNHSDIPAKIMIAYDLASTRLGTQILPPFHYSDYDYNIYATMAGCMYNELFTLFTAQWTFPLLLPNPEKMVEKAIEKLRSEMSVKSEPREEDGNSSSCGGERAEYNSASNEMNFYNLIFDRQERICQIHRDATEKKLEAEVQHEQKKLEAKGKLALLKRNYQSETTPLVKVV